ncbi:MAG: hypothetical protein Q7R35_07005 [Elusimicrobiota bacterium]|nr:hypothetical protein [Elusimicrobiota bacterium]
MSPSALFMLVVAEVTVTAFTIYFFWKVVTVPPRTEPDSFDDNDDVER